ncbi:hypothetical protein FB45DRAFT_1098284 [Roridomyces roridus]|uniref:F-box domain-containing protein n=1 Tax=Roridomyces roridus TaxID=1738132 RepID=A0AAD7CDP7_9AGAR|nr:hypothetical protein FB45DRAFT_1098284 [Roridomyces roridus]
MDTRHSFVLPKPPIPPASIAPLLASNSAPEGLEERIARAHIAELEKHADFLDNTHKSILSPLRRLPNELLAEIFTMVIRDTLRFDNNVPRPWSQPPWTLARVCRRWTAVALGTSSLWSRVLLHLNLIGLGEGAVTMTQLLHQRSGSAPLMVSIHDDCDKETRGVLNLAFTHCERWKHVRLSGLFLAPMTPLISEISTVRERLPALTTLRIHAELKDAEDSLAEFRDIFAITPNLTAIDAWFQHRDGFLLQPPFEFPWRQLTTLSISFARSEQALPIFPQLSTIVNLRVQLKWAGVSPTQSPIILPHLRMLELYSQRGLDSPTSPPLLSCLTSPLLRHLAVHNEAEKDAVLNFLKRSECELKSFHFFHSFAISPGDAVALIGEMLWVRDVKIGYFNSPADPPPESITEAIYSHWLNHRNPLKVKSGTSRLSVCIADNNHPPIDPEINSDMQTNGMFVEILRDVWEFDSLVDATFEV